MCDELSGQFYKNLRAPLVEYAVDEKGVVELSESLVQYGEVGLELWKRGRSDREEVFSEGEKGGEEVVENEGKVEGMMKGRNRVWVFVGVGAGIAVAVIGGVVVGVGIARGI